MRIESTQTSVAPPKTSQSSACSSDASLAVAQPTSEPITPSTTMVIAGQTLLRQRLFFSVPDVEPPVISDKKLMNSNLPTVQFLTLPDRELLGRIYEVSQSEGIDLRYVDQLGQSLAQYRCSDNGRLRLSHTDVTTYDPEGHRLTFSFTERDVATADRVRQSSALQTTELDKGFIKFDTDPNYSVVSHSHLGFLEWAMSRFSASDDRVPASDAFKTYTYISKDFIEYTSKEVYPLFRDCVDQESADKTLISPVSSTSPQDPAEAPLALRTLIQKTLQKTGLPSLFETLIRMGR